MLCGQVQGKLNNSFKLLNQNLITLVPLHVLCSIFINRQKNISSLPNIGQSKDHRFAFLFRPSTCNRPIMAHTKRIKATRRAFECVNGQAHLSTRKRIRFLFFPPVQCLADVWALCVFLRSGRSGVVQ